MLFLGILALLAALLLCRARHKSANLGFAAGASTAYHRTTILGVFHCSVLDFSLSFALNAVGGFFGHFVLYIFMGGISGENLG